MQPKRRITLSVSRLQALRAPRAWAVPGLLLLAVPVLAAATAEWTPVPNMAAARYAPTATVLGGTSANKGRVLVTGGYNGGQAVTSAQLFDPNAPSGTNPWSTTGSLRTGRSFHVATDL